MPEAYCACCTNERANFVTLFKIKNGNVEWNFIRKKASRDSGKYISVVFQVFEKKFERI
jgi:hypothetical protein